MKAIYINDDFILNDVYKKREYKKKKFKKRKINNIKLPKGIIIIFIIIMISIILYLILIKRKKKTNRNEKINLNSFERRESIINKKTNLYSNETRIQVTNEKINIYSNEAREPIINKQIKAYSIDKDLDEEYKDMQEYVYMVMNGSLYNPNEIFKITENPKISIVISVYNGEAYLKAALLSIQNQDFKDIEIIMVDDCSKDNSVNLIKELMMKEPRIKLYQNEENKGMLYTKTRGVLNSKGKYVMILDEDDIYVQKDAFSTLYYEAEENNLDILGFGLMRSGIHLEKGVDINRYLKTNIIYQPNIQNRNIECNSNNCKRVGDFISNYFFRTDLFVDAIKEIDDKFMNVKMLYLDDYLLFFILTKKAHSLKQIKRIFYIMFNQPNENNDKIQFRLNEKHKNGKKNLCLAYINYIEFILIKTNNDINDKRTTSFELKEWFLKNNCRYNENIRERSNNVLKLFLKNDYIENEVKNEILAFLNETNRNISMTI